MTYTSLTTIKLRIDYRGEDFFDINPDNKFDDLLTQLEKETRGLINSYMGDETFSEETGRVDELVTTSDAALPLVGPINDVSKIEYKISPASDWETLNSDRYTNTKYRIVLEPRTGITHRRRNPLTQLANRSTWRDLGRKIRVTYDRGYSTIPPEVQNIQISMINQILRKLRTEQSISAANPEDISSVSEAGAVFTEDIRQRIDDLTKFEGVNSSV